MMKAIAYIDTTGPARKARLVKIYKNEVYEDIELHTFKHVDASGIQDLGVRNAVAADNAEDQDGVILARNVEFRDSQLRIRIQHALGEPPRVVESDDLILMHHNLYMYYLLLPEEFRDDMLKPLAEYIHRYLAFGAIADWYMMLGQVAQGQNYASIADAAADQIDSLLRGPSIVKRPLQPFGPR